MTDYAYITLVLRVFCIVQVTSRSHDSISPVMIYIKVSKGAKIRNRYNRVPYLTQDTNGKVTNLQLDTTKVSPFTAGDHRHI